MIACLSKILDSRKFVPQHKVIREIFEHLKKLGILKSYQHKKIMIFLIS